VIEVDSALIIYGLDLFGVAVFAVSGSLAAGRKHMDIFGVTVLGLVTALGGGSLRDTLLDVGPVFWVEDPVYLLVAVAASLFTFMAVRAITIPWRGLLISDAIGLAVFMAIGTAKALAITNSSSVAIIMGVMTGVAGGMIRDVLSAEVPLVLRREIYATAALCGALTYVILIRLGMPSIPCLMFSAAATLSIRLAAIHWGFSLPVFRSKDDLERIDSDDSNNV
jgi:uncharacterized membrane protein YeiH